MRKPTELGVLDAWDAAWAPVESQVGLAWRLGLTKLSWRIAESAVQSMERKKMGRPPKG